MKTLKKSKLKRKKEKHFIFDAFSPHTESRGTFRPWRTCWINWAEVSSVPLILWRTFFCSIQFFFFFFFFIPTLTCSKTSQLISSLPCFHFSCHTLSPWPNVSQFQGLEIRGSGNFMQFRNDSRALEFLNCSVGLSFPAISFQTIDFSDPLNDAGYGAEKRRKERKKEKKARSQPFLFITFCMATLSYITRPSKISWFLKIVSAYINFAFSLHHLRDKTFQSSQWLNFTVDLIITWDNFFEGFCRFFSPNRVQLLMFLP